MSEDNKSLEEQLNNLDDSSTPEQTPEPKKKGKKGGATKFEKGKSGNPKGRPVGTKNVTTQELRDALQLIMTNNIPTLQEDLDRMNKFQKWTILEKLSGKFLPNLTQADLNANVNGNMRIIIVQDGEEDKEITN